MIADGSYRTLRTVRAGNGYPTDLHEFVITRAGDALFTVYSPVMVHLPGTPAGARSPLLDSIVQEVDIRTGLVVWEWHALGHIPLKDSYATPTNSADYDAFHINSMQPLRRQPTAGLGPRHVRGVPGRSRHRADPVDARRQGQQLPPGSRGPLLLPARRADAHVNRIGLFDDEGGPPSRQPTSRGLILSLDLRHRTATLVRGYRRRAHGPPAESEGSLQQSPAGACSSASARRRSSPSSPAMAVSCSTPACPRVTGATGSSCSRGPRRPRPGRRSPCAGLTDTSVGLRELERGHDRGPLAGTRRPERNVARPPDIGGQTRLRDKARPVQHRHHLRGARAERKRPGPGHLQTNPRSMTIRRARTLTTLLVAVAVTLGLTASPAGAAQGSTRSATS